MATRGSGRSIEDQTRFMRWRCCHDVPGAAYTLGMALRTCGVLLFGCLGCAGARPGPERDEQLVLSIQNLACLDCGKELEERASSVAGVRKAHFEGSKIELNVDVAAGTPPQTIIAAVEKEPIDGRPVKALLGAGQGRFAPFQPLNPAWDARVLSAHGEDVESFSPTPGRVTVVDFFADWCGPCHELDDVMHDLLQEHASSLAYRRLNVVDWESPLAKHYLVGASELPYVIVLDTQGHEVTRIAGLRTAELRAAIEKGQQR